MRRDDDRSGGRSGFSREGPDRGWLGEAPAEGIRRLRERFAPTRWSGLTAIPAPLLTRPRRPRSETARPSGCLWREPVLRLATGREVARVYVTPVPREPLVLQLQPGAPPRDAV